MRLLVTGGAGFIGSSFARLALGAGHAVTVLDALTYCGNLANLDAARDHAGYRFVKGDIGDKALWPALLSDAALGAPFEALVNFAAESHVDRSILDATPFVLTNVAGTQVILDAVRAYGERNAGRAPRFLQVSTDEVYGSADDGKPFTESTPLKPNSPYAASKAGADMLVAAYHHTFGLDTVITRCSNNYGPHQFPEKLIPLFTTNLFEGKLVPVYGDGKQVRDWIHCDDHSRGVLAALERGASGAVYNLGGSNPAENLAITKLLLKLTGRDESFIAHVKDRPGHDRKYLIDHGKATRELGWSPRVKFEDGLAETVRWYREHEGWWRAIKSGEYLKYYERQYGDRGGSGT
ncbi:MAG: dTDP-glucose 4,6-dehydratase [Planctomycetota bacterium]|nr:dTDP-glucose 4,6-dehydratase [Planctomycetota bacterium]